MIEIFANIIYSFMTWNMNKFISLFLLTHVEGKMNAILFSFPFFIFYLTIPKV